MGIMVRLFNGTSPSRPARARVCVCVCVSVCVYGRPCLSVGSFTDAAVDVNSDRHVESL
jgi:hypothetical protein